MSEIYDRCKMSLSFLKKSVKIISQPQKYSLSENASIPQKNNYDNQIYDNIPNFNSIDENLNAEFYDNNYWNKKVCDFAFEIIQPCLLILFY